MTVFFALPSLIQPARPDSKSRLSCAAAFIHPAKKIGRAMIIRVFICWLTVYPVKIQ
jgi:hypothetical protein